MEDITTIVLTAITILITVGKNEHLHSIRISAMGVLLRHYLLCPHGILCDRFALSATNVSPLGKQMDTCLDAFIRTNHCSSCVDWCDCLDYYI